MKTLKPILGIAGGSCLGCSIFFAIFNLVQGGMNMPTAAFGYAGLAMLVCFLLMEVSELRDNEEIWDGNLVSLAENSSLLGKIQWYCSIVAKKEYQIVPLKVNGLLQFADLDNREIVEIGPDFKIAKRQPLKITSGEQCFKNEFLTDKATGKTYGLFVEDGMNHIGLYDPEAGAVGMGQKASKKIYPRVFKVHGGYAYSVFFDSGSNRGVISRMKIE